MERQEKGMGKQAANPAAFNFAEAGFGDRPDLDDDGRDKRTGTLVTASAHIITAVIGSGVLSLAWAISQLAWVIGPAVLVAFSVITWFFSSLLADCYRSPDPVHGKRNYTYDDAVRANLGVAKYRLCSFAQYVNLVGVTIGYTITTAISMGAIKRSNRFHHNGHDAKCEASNTTNKIIFASLLADCYRSPDPVHGKRNYTYGDAVRANLGVAMSQSNKLLLRHLPLLLLASAAAAEAHHRISGNQFRWPRCVQELAHTMNVQPLGTTVHAAQGGTVDVDGGLIANTYKALHGVARSAGHNGMIDVPAVLVPGRAEAETLASDCDHPVVTLDEWWNWHAQAAAGVAAVPSVLVGEPQLSLSYSVRACFNCSLLASGIRDAMRPDCSSPAPFTVAAGKAYHIVTSSGLLFDRAVHLSTARLIALIMVLQVAVDDQRRKNGGGRDAAAMALLILLVIASLPNAAVAARPLHDGGGVHDQTAAGPVAAEPAGMMPESRVAAGSACTNDPNTQDPHRCVHH